MKPALKYIRRYIWLKFLNPLSTKTKSTTFYQNKKHRTKSKERMYWYRMIFLYHRGVRSPETVTTLSVDSQIWTLLAYRICITIWTRILASRRSSIPLGINLKLVGKMSLAMGYLGLQRMRIASWKVGETHLRACLEGGMGSVTRRW